MRAAVIANRPLVAGDDDVAELIELYSTCAKFGVLPRPGGLLDQPARLVYLLNEARRVFDEFEEIQRRRNADDIAAKSRR